MAVRDIRTSIKLDGEKAFKDALDGATRNLRVMSADLKAASAEFDNTGDKQRYMTEKSRLLRDEIAQQEKVVDSLVNAVRDSSAQYGDSSSKTDGYRIKLSNATATLQKMKKQLDETDREARDFGRTSEKVGRQIKDGIGEGADGAKDSLEEMLSTVKQDISSIKGSTTFAVAGQVISTVVGAVQGVTSFVESNQEYRRNMAYLEEAGKSAGVSWEDVQAALFDVAGMTGDLDGATEGISNLLTSGLYSDGPEWFAHAIELFKGAAIKWNDTMKFENLSESFQETVATGKGAGAFAELIERLGIDLDAFNFSMDGLKAVDERRQAALTAISGKGLEQTKWSFEDSQKSLLESTQAKLELDQAWADLAEELEPTVTEFTKGLTTAVNTVTAMIKGFKDILSGDETIFKPTPTPVDSQSGARLDTAYDFAGAAGVRQTMAATPMSATERQEWADYFTGQYGSDVSAEIFGSTVEQATQAGAESSEAYMDAVKATVEAGAGEIDLEQIYDAMGINAVKEAILLGTFTDADKAYWIKYFNGLGYDLTGEFGGSLTDGLDAAASNAKVGGGNVATQIGNGINQQSGFATSAAAKMVSDINRILSQLGAGFSMPAVTGPNGGGYTASNRSTNGNVQVALTLDGRQVGNAIAPYVGASLGNTVSRTRVV